MMLRKIAAVLVTVFCVWAVCEAQCKRALVIGIGEYEDVKWKRINGDKDVSIIQQMLSSLGYADISTLVNEEATKTGILAEMDSLTNRCHKGDIVYVHFSGHGQQVSDLNGDERFNHINDHYDEAWIPYDAEPFYTHLYKGENHLIDDEIAVILKGIRERIGKKGGLLVVVDACHSGDSDRNFDEEEDENMVVRGLDKPFEIPVGSMPVHVDKVEEDWLTLTACNSAQVNCEMRTANGENFGVLSHALFSMQDQLASLSNNEILALISKYIYENGMNKYDQTPTLTGNTTTYKICKFFKK